MLLYLRILTVGLLAMMLSACPDSEPAPAQGPEPDAGSDSPCADGCMPDDEGHACCGATFDTNNGEYFCGSGQRCVELAFCEGESCCKPGPMGHEYCAETFGIGSRCEAMADTGACSLTSVECPTCTVSAEGHQCCQEALGENYICVGEGACIEIQACMPDNEECCIPGSTGNAGCVGRFGDGSECQIIGSGGRCTMSQVPVCAGCEPDDEGHRCCEEAFGPFFYCAIEGICRETSGCEAPDCCVPGASGDTWCRDQFGEGSTCGAVDGDGRCIQPGPGAP